MAEVDTAKHRMTAWRASLRKDKKTTALQMDKERREEPHLSGLALLWKWMRANVEGVVSHCDIYAFGCVIIVLFQQRQLWPGLNGPVENFYEESLTVAEV